MNLKKASVGKRKSVQKQLKMLEHLVVEYVPIGSILANDYNPNRQSEHEFELLLRSMEDDGFTQPILVNDSGVIVDGEHRWRAAQVLGMEEVPIVRVSMSEAQAKISTLRHNLARGSHDIELEARVLRDLQTLGALNWAQEALMLTEQEMHKLLEDTDAVLGESRKGSLSHEALMASLEQETEKVQERAHEERVFQAKDEDILRLVLLFHGEDAELVKSSLGVKPSETLLALAVAHDLE